MVDILIHLYNADNKPLCSANTDLNEEQLKHACFTKQPVFQGVICEKCGEIRVFKILDEIKKD